MSVWKSDETLLSICILNFSFKNDFVWEEISNIRHSVSSPDETLHLMFDILRERALSPVLENFRRAFSPGPTDRPWVSEDGFANELPYDIYYG